MNPEEIKYLEGKIREILWRMYRTFSGLTHLWEFGDDTDPNYPYEESEMRLTFSEDAESLVHVIGCYLEERGLTKQYTIFQNDIAPILNDKSLYDATPDEDSNLYSTFLHKVWRFIL
ncbi:MAG: hypothetical protein JKX73_02755, partial [Flavobacteriales bacterium]|nr:hypothetical protein [Flavobacteriales bacterium]